MTSLLPQDVFYLFILTDVWWHLSYIISAPDFLGVVFQLLVGWHGWHGLTRLRDTGHVGTGKGGKAERQERKYPWADIEAFPAMTFEDLCRPSRQTKFPLAACDSVVRGDLRKSQDLEQDLWNVKDLSLTIATILGKSKLDFIERTS